MTRLARLASAGFGLKPCARCQFLQVRDPPPSSTHDGGNIVGASAKDVKGFLFVWQVVESDIGSEFAIVMLFRRKLMG